MNEITIDIDNFIAYFRMRGNGWELYWRFLNVHPFPSESAAVVCKLQARKGDKFKTQTPSGSFFLVRRNSFSRRQREGEDNLENITF